MMYVYSKQEQDGIVLFSLLISDQSYSKSKLRKL